MLGKLTLWQRIAVPVLGMALGIIIVSGFLVRHYYERLDQARGMTRSVETIQSVSSIIHEIQKERGVSVLYFNKAIGMDELKAQRDLADQKFSFLFERKDQLPSPDMLQRIKAIKSEHEGIRQLVDQRGTSATEVARMFGVLVDNWVQVQISCAHAFHLDGLEATLLSIAIFEKSKESMGRLRALMNAVLSANQPIHATTVSLLATHRSGIIANMESPGLKISPASAAEIQRLLAAADWQTVLQTYDTVIEKSDAGNFGYDAKTYSATITRVIDGIGHVIIPEITMTRGQIEKAASAAQQAFVICMGAVLSLIIIAILTAAYVTSRINASLQAVAELLNQGAAAVARIAAQVAIASQKLATSATQQASAMQETTAAVEETQSMIKRNADNSIRSAEISHKSHESALKGREVISEMTRSIEDIAQSNHEIMQQNEVTNKDLMEIVRVINEIEGKTRVINDIVFQTRLLSFNASVEAARAGEHGKGFAVVAEEVGQLAQMSGSSARDIQSMLDGSVKLVHSIVASTRQKVAGLTQNGKEKIEAGVIGAERCSHILQEIVENVAQVERMTNEISGACREQAEGISEINEAMVEMDAAAHANSVACEQTSASAAELKQHAGKLLSMVRQLETVIHGTQSRQDHPKVETPRVTAVPHEEWDEAA